MSSLNEAEAVFEVSTYDQSLIEDNAHERFGASYGDLQERDKMISAGFLDASGDADITAEGWEQLNKDIERMEQNALRWLRDTFTHIRNDGHHDDTLVGVVWFDPTDRRQAELISLASASPGSSERIDMTDASYGDLAKTAFNGVSEFGRNVLGGAVYFSDVDEKTWEIIEETLSSPQQPQRGTKITDLDGLPKWVRR